MSRVPNAALGHSRPGRVSSKSGHVRHAAESGSKFGALEFMKARVIFIQSGLNAVLERTRATSAASTGAAASPQLLRM